MVFTTKLKDEYLIDLTDFFESNEKLRNDLLCEPLLGHFMLAAHSDWLFFDNDVDRQSVQTISEHEQQLLIASKLASRLRAKLRQQLGYTVTVGVAHSKSVAKMAGSSHKPDTLSCVSPAKASLFLTDIPLRHIAGFSSKFVSSLDSKLSLGGRDVTCGEMRQVPLDMLELALGKEQALHTFNVVRGVDNTPITNSESKPKIISCDSFANNLKKPNEIRIFYGFFFTKKSYL